MLIVAEYACIFIKGISGEENPAASMIGPFPDSDTVRVMPSPEAQIVPDWVKETNTWRNGAKDGRLREVGAGTGNPTHTAPAGPNPPAGVKVEEGQPLMVDP